MSKKIIIFIVALTLVLSGLVIWWLTRQPPVSVSEPVPSIENVVTTPVELQPWQAPVSEKQPLTPQAVAQTNIKNEALRFAEIYGSFSTDAPYQNIKAIEHLFTPSFKSVVTATITSAVPAAGFYGVTTRALTAEIQSQTESSAVIMVSTQREELFSHQGEPQLRYQDIRLVMLKQGDNWLVDKAEWQ